MSYSSTPSISTCFFGCELYELSELLLILLDGSYTWYQVPGMSFLIYTFFSGVSYIRMGGISPSELLPISYRDL